MILIWVAFMPVCSITISLILSRVSLGHPSLVAATTTLILLSLKSTHSLFPSRPPNFRSGPR